MKLYGAAGLPWLPHALCAGAQPKAGWQPGRASAKYAATPGHCPDLGRRNGTMGLGKVTVDDINVKGQRVLVRCDFNVPMKDGVITT